MNRLVLAAALSTVALAVPASAAAQAAPSLSDSTDSAAAAAAKPKASGLERATVRITKIGHLKGHSARILTKVPVKGTITPFVPGQRVDVNFYVNGKKVLTRRVKPKHRGDHGTFTAIIAVKQGGKYAVSAEHKATRLQRGDRTVRKSWKVSFPSISSGKCGKVVGAFRRALNELGYVPGGGKCFNGKMGRAVLAFRKVNGMNRNEKASKRVVRQVFAGQGGYKAKHPGAGEHVEASLSKQIIAFSKGDRVVAVYPISSGKPSTPTVQGHFNFYMTQPGYNSEGMYYSFYFIGGYAIHGYESVPNYPASHGCLRTYISDQPEIYNRIHYGEDIFVF